jgi:hypothetical protein
MAWGLVSCGESSNRVDASAGGSANGEGASGGSAAVSMSGASAGGAAAGTTSEDTASYFEPGSRLKPRVLALDDGVDVLRDVATDSSWYDSELEFDCFFVPDETGVERCFPRQYLSRSTYADADCTRRVLLDGSAGTCASLRYPYVVLEEGGCSYRGFRVGKELPQSTPLFYSDGTSCKPSPQSEAIPIYEVEEVPSERFVGMQRAQRPRAPGLEARVREGDDGSWQIMGYFDPVREAACSDLFIGFDPPSKCVPTHASASQFADSTCQTRIASVHPTACNVERPTAIIDARVDVDSCPTALSFELYEIEAIRETSAYEVDDAGACVVKSLPPRESYVQGAAIDASTLPTLETLVVGTGAVRSLFSGFGGVPYAPIAYRHTGLLDEAGGECLPFRFPDGSLRCVPTSFSHATSTALAYEDASCEGSPVAAWVARPTCPADPPLPPGVMLVDPTACELAVTELMAVVGQSTASTLYAKDATSGACKAITMSSPAPTYLRLGEVLDAATFTDLKPTMRQ